MNGDIDFTKGIYKGDDIEEIFKPFSTKYMPFWWYFREVLRANLKASSWWQKSDGTALSDEEQKELVALSLLNYSVYTSMADAVAFLEQLHWELHRTTSAKWRVFEVRRAWKAMYSSLYTSFNALCNIVCVAVGHKSPFGAKPGFVWNYGPKQACDLVNRKGIKEIADPLGQCRVRLQIRDHLDHYWLIWHSLCRGEFLLDSAFEKGYLPIRPPAEAEVEVDALKLAKKHVVNSAKDFNSIYQELAIEGGHLDEYLSAKGWRIDYSDYGPHNGRRPRP